MLNFLIIFSLSLFITSIILFIKKKYLYFIFPCILFLPDYYGIEISETLPIITISRIMILVFFVYSFSNRRRSINFSKINYNSLPKEYFFLAGYFILRIISNLYYVTTYSQAAKTVMSIVIEQFLLLVAIYILSPTKAEIITTLKAVVWTSAVLFMIGVFESYTYIRPFDSLYTVSRSMLYSRDIRLGFLRATTTMVLPGLYGNMCILIIPMILYLYELTRSKKYLIVCALSILAIIHSGSRADILFLIAVIMYYFIFVLKGKTRKVLFVRNFITIAISILIFISVASYKSEYCKYYYITSGKAILNEFGFNFDLNKDAPYGVSGYGRNEIGNQGTIGGINSRKTQLSGITYVLNRSPLFGLGQGALNRRDLMYYFFDHWIAVNAIDVGLVEVIAYEGLIGLVAHIFLILSLLSYCKYFYQKPYILKLCTLYLFTYLLTTTSTVNMYSFLLLYITHMFSEKQEV